MRVACEPWPPARAGRSFHTAYRLPPGSMVVLGISKFRTSWPGWVWMTSRRSEALLQATIASPEPFTGAIVVIRETDPVPTAAVAIISLAAVTLAFVHPAGTDCSQETYMVSPAGTGLDPCPQASEAD